MSTKSIEVINSKPANGPLYPPLFDSSMRISLLDLYQETYPSGSEKPALNAVTLPQQNANVDLHALQLSDACALLSHGGTAASPLAGESNTAYLQRVIDQLCELSLKDPLTGLANRRHFLTVLERELSIVARSGESTLLLMLDLDHFKRVNDSHGHLVGDKVLQAVAVGLKSCVRPKDTVVRYGGEEFAVVLPDCHVTYGMVVAERMRELIQSLKVATAPGVHINVTMSIGGAFASQMIGSKASDWIALADKELYRAKSGGRNRVCIDQPLMVEVSPEEKSQLFVDFSQNDSRWGGSFYGDLQDEVDAAFEPHTPEPEAGNTSAKQSTKTQESLG
jgi:two-component system, cell cycle response regulator